MKLRSLFAVSGAAVLLTLTLGHGPANAAPAQTDDCSTAIGKAATARGITQGYFSCYGSVVQLTEKGGKKREILGSIVSGATEEVTGRSANVKAATTQKFDTPVSTSGTGVAPRANTEPCRPANSSKSVTKIDTYHARGQVNICYGEYVARFFQPLEIRWSEWVRYSVNQGLTNRTNQEIRWINTGTTDQPDVVLHWDIRYSTPGAEDDYYGPAKEVNIPAWRVGEEANSTYGIGYTDLGTYHMTHAQIDIIGGQTHFYGGGTSYPNVRMPDFICTTSSFANPVPCTFA